MKSLLAPSLYCDESVFEQERRTVFQSSWQLVGFRSELAGHNDYIAFDLNGKSIVVQNFDGILRAFHNVCSHRQSRIRSECAGNGPLRCPYHGWTYGADGTPTGIPGRALFDPADLADRQSLALESYAVDTCGDFVFIRTAPSGPSLAEFLGDAWAFVETAGTSLGERLSCYRLTMKANWKIVVENTLEAYHVDHVHRNSLKRLGVSGTRFDFHGLHSTYTSPTAVEKPGAARDRLNEAFASRPFKTDQYIHQLVFPGATIATAHGTTFNVNLIRASAPEQTEVVVYMFETRLGELTRSQMAMVRAMRPAVVELTNTTFDEDKVICEQVQLGMRESGRHALLGQEEQRIEAFQSSYLRLLNGGASS